MKALLPLAGLGTRMAPLGVTTPKALLTVLNKPILRWTLEAFWQNGVHEFVLVVNPGDFGQKIRAYVETVKQDPAFADADFQFVEQAEQKGTAHVVQMGAELLKNEAEFLMVYGDDLYGPGNIAAVLAAPGAAVIGKEVADPEKFGILQQDAQGHLQKVVEKPTAADIAQIGKLANIGCMKLPAAVFTLFEQLKPSPRGELEITDTLNLLAANPATPVTVVPSNDYWLPVGYPWHLLSATEVLAPQISDKREGTIEEGVTIKGKVVLPKSSVMKSGTYIEGNVVIGENSVVGPHAYVRENVSIGNNCKVGFSVEVKNSIIGDGTQVPHLSYVGDSILGADVNFAGGSATANFRHDGGEIATPVKGEMVSTGRVKFGSVMGDGVRLGAGTIVYPGRKLWPAVTTLPGEVVEKDKE